MTGTTRDVVALGNAIVDVLSHADEAFLQAQALSKGAMTLIDEDRARELYAAMGPGVESSGGSAANTVVGVAALGGRAGFIGRVQADTLGEVFAHDIRAAGVAFPMPRPKPGKATARCLINVTADAQRTMATFLGAASDIDPEDVDEAMVASAQVTYLEGYLWDQPAAKDALRKAADVARAAGRQVAMSLSDAFCVDRHRDAFRGLVEGPLDIVFANEAEIVSLYQSATFDDALAAIRGKVRLAVLTRSEKGCVVVTPDAVHEVPAVRPARLVDTTGAGDLFAAGFLYGLTQGRDVVTCARIGAIAAAEIISHYGARPEADLKALVAGV